MAQSINVIKHLKYASIFVQIKTILVTKLLYPVDKSNPCKIFNNNEKILKINQTFTRITIMLFYSLKKKV